MLNVVNNMLIDNKIFPQQILNKRKGLLKRKGKRHTATAFLFLFVSKCFVNGFVEDVYYRTSICYVTSSTIQRFFTLNKSAVEATEVNTAIHRLVGRTSILPTDKGKPMSLAKRKRRKIPTSNIADTAAGFWEAKSHSSLGRFLHAPLTLMLKTPQ